MACIDWSSQEVGIAAALSGDEIMMADFRSGDPYIAFGVGAGILPSNATKKSHEAERTAIKACVLGLQYGMGEYTLASASANRNSRPVNWCARIASATASSG